MKKLNYLLLGAAGLLMASCASDDVTAPMADGNFTVRIQLPADMATRAEVTPTGNEYGQGYEAQKLLYFVYECDDNGNITNYVTQGDTYFPANSLETEVGFSLANGKYYQIAFFAESEQAYLQEVYNLDVENTTPSMTVDYTKMVFNSNNVDAYDCFYRLYGTGQIGAASTNSSPTVLLYRPMAQINWGTNDYGKTAVVDPNAFGPNPATTIQTEFTADLYTKFDMVTSNVDENDTPVTTRFKAMNVPNIYQFPIEGYNYLAMQYVLAPAAENNKEEGGYVYDLNLNVQSTVANHNIDVVVDNAPVQANWRTNIYGSLLTDNFKVYVVKEPTFWGEYNLGEWDGMSVTMPQQNEDGVYQVNAPSDLAGLAQMIENGEITAEDSFQLNADLDFGGHEFSGLGSGSFDNSNKTGEGNAFKGTFDGQGHTISNVVINGTTVANDAIGFFPYIEGDATIKDVTFNNVTISADNNLMVGGVVGVVNNGGTIENVTVQSGNITGYQQTGGIVGRIYGSATLNNCNNYAKITAVNQNAGGIVGQAYYPSSTTAINLTNCTNYGDVIDGSPEGSKVTTMGGIVGTNGASLTNCVNNGNILGKSNTVAVGGIVGYQGSCGVISGCENNGRVNGGSETGGIVAFVAGSAYPNAIEVPVVKNCTNNGALVSTGAVGGILGINSATITLQNNTNNAPSITGQQNAAGIVGNGRYSANPVDGGNGYVNLDGNVNNTPISRIKGSKVNLIFCGTVWMDGAAQTY